MREREGLRKRYQSDLLQFWRRCADARCRRKRICKGDPDGCLGRGLAAMSEQDQDKDWLRGAIMTTVKGARTMEELVRGMDEEIAAARCAKPMDVQQLAACLTQLLADPAGSSPSRQADAKAHVVVSERQSPASQGTGTAEPALPADPSPTAARHGAGPINQHQACCDDEGRLIIPDLTEQKERVMRGLTWAEIVARGRV